MLEGLKQSCILKDPLSGLRQFLTTESPFYFMVNALLVLEIFTFLL